MIRFLFLIALAQLLAVSACAQSAHQTGRDVLDQVLPADVRRQIDSTVGFSEVEAAPSNYVGRMVMFSGIVLKAKKIKDRTEIEVLQLPTDSGAVPSSDRPRSEGRFLAIETKFLDPATIESGTPVTVVVEVKGAATRSLDDSEYTYPVIEITRLVDWDKTMPTNYSGAAPYPYYGGYYRPHPYLGGPYGYYPYWGPYYPLLFGSPAPAPSMPPMPPPQSIPPQFRKRK